MGRKKQPDSWRSKGKGDCFTTKGGQVVCEGSKGMNYKKKGYTKSTKVGTRVKNIGAGQGGGRYKITETTGKRVKLIKTSNPEKSKKKGGKGKIINLTKEQYQKSFTRE